MSRSNGPVTRGSSRRQDWQPSAEPDLGNEPTEAAHHQPYQWPAMFPQQAHGRPTHAAPETDYGTHAHHPQANEPYPSYHYPQDQYAPDHYGQDHYTENGYGAGAGDAYQPYVPPVQHPPFFGDQQYSHAPQPRPYAASDGRYPPVGAQEQAYSPAQRPGVAHDNQGLSQLQATGAARGSSATLRDQLQAVRNGQWQQPHAQREPSRPMHDLRDYDLGSYSPAGDPVSPTYGAAHGQQGEPFDGRWQDAHGYAHADAHQSSAADYYAQLSADQLPVPEEQQAFDDPDADDSDDFEYEEPRGGRRGLLIAAALVGAILVGGGLAYGYKTIVGPAPSGAPPVIKADVRPAKEQPEDPGGRQFAHSDSKLMGRLDSDSSNATSGSRGAAIAGTLDDTDASGVRRVPTVIIGRDGSIAPPSAEPRLPPPTVSVPGMTIVDGFGGRPTMLPRREEPQRSADVPPAPRIIARADPEPETKAPAQAATASAPPPPVRSATVEPERPAAAARQPAATRQPAQPAPRQAAAAPAQRSNPVGYVAVLASQKSRIDALKTFADLQQKYNHVLQNKIPDVLEADLSARGLGTMYRVVVGPPSSREAAADLCGQLKSAGFQGCWITAY